MQPLEDALAAQERDMYEPATPRDVPVLWVRPEAPRGGTVVPFPPRPRPESPRDSE